MKKTIVALLFSSMLCSCGNDERSMDKMYSINSWYEQDKTSFNLSTYVEDNYIVYSEKSEAKRFFSIHFSIYEDDVSREPVIKDDDCVIILESGTELKKKEFECMLFSSENVKFKIYFPNLKENQKSKLLEWQNDGQFDGYISINDDKFMNIGEWSKKPVKVPW